MGAGLISAQWMQFIEAQPCNLADPALRGLIGFTLFGPTAGRNDSLLEGVDCAQTGSTGRSSMDGLPIPQRFP